MTFKEFLKFVMIAAMPIIIAAIIMAVVITLITETELIGLILAIISAILLAFIAIKWICFLDDHSWI